MREKSRMTSWCLPWALGCKVVLFSGPAVQEALHRVSRGASMPARTGWASAGSLGSGVCSGLPQVVQSPWGHQRRACVSVK